MFFKIDADPSWQMGVQLFSPLSLVCMFSGKKQNFKYLDKFLKYILAYFLKKLSFLSPILHFLGTWGVPGTSSVLCTKINIPKVHRMGVHCEPSYRLWLLPDCSERLLDAHGVYSVAEFLLCGPVVVPSVFTRRVPRARSLGSFQFALGFMEGTGFEGEPITGPGVGCVLSASETLCRRLVLTL